MMLVVEVVLTPPPHTHTPSAPPRHEYLLSRLLGALEDSHLRGGGGEERGKGRNEGEGWGGEGRT